MAAEHRTRARTNDTTTIDLALGRHVPWMLQHHTEHRRDHPFLIWEPFSGPCRRWTYGEFALAVARLGGGLLRAGVRPGDRVMIHLENCPEFVLTWFACAHIGATAVCTNTRSSEAELRYFGEHAEVRAAVTDDEHAALVERAVPTASWVATRAHDDDPDDRVGAMPFDDLVGDAVGAGELLPHQPVSIQYTSGTTARPKAVVWTHANAVFGAQMSAIHEGLRDDDIHLVHLPLFHTNAQMYSMLATMWSGATAVLQPRFSASRFWDVAVRNCCTWSSVVPFCVKALAAQGPPPAHSFRFWGSGVSRPPEDDLFGVRTIGWFGMTETVTHCAYDDPEHPGRRLGMGRPAPEYRLRLVNDDGKPVGLEQPGNLEVLGIPGLSLFDGYLHDEAATRSSYTADGWFRTGDHAVLHPDGYLSFAGRQKDMMKVGGENVAAAEVERVIARVAGVSEAAVVGRPDEMLSEVPVVFVIPSGGADGLAERIVAACRAELASFKVPREVRVVDDLPRSTLNKVAKGELRRLAAAEPPISG